MSTYLSGSRYLASPACRPAHLNVLKAIAAHRDVHLFLLHPSDDLWEEVASRAPHPPPSLPRQDDPTARLPKNPLLRSWGRDAREMQLVLAGHGITGGTHRPVDAGEMPNDPPGPDPGGYSGRQGATWLSGTSSQAPRSQAPGSQAPGSHKAGDRAPVDVKDPRPLLADDDDSLRMHSCHGRARQVEVVREAVLHLSGGRPHPRAPRRNRDVPRHRAFRSPRQRHLWGRQLWPGRLS